MASVFFRADSLSDSWVLINNLFNNFSPGLDALASNADNIRKQVLFLGTEAINFKLLIGLMFILELTQWNLRKQDLDTLFNKIPIPFRLFIYAAASVIIILMLNVAEKPFIYFQF